MHVKGFEAIDAIESQYRGFEGKPTLGKSYALLMERWDRGEHDRETALRLLFLVWLSRARAIVLTDLEVVNFRPEMTHELLTAVGGEDAEDEEVCFVLSVMTEVAARALGDETYWEELGGRFRDRLGDRRFHMDPRAFEDRGAYGDYFANQVRTHIEFAAKNERAASAGTERGRDRSKDH